MEDSKRSYEDAFKRKVLDSVKEDEFYVEHTVYKVIKRNCIEKNLFNITTLENSNFQYAESIIKATASSATIYKSEKKSTKTELIELFSNLSLNDIWSATFFKYDTDKNWQDVLSAKIQSMSKEEAAKYIKDNFKLFGKVERKITGQKIALKSDNNYYSVRDLDIYFEEMKSKGVENAIKNSQRKLDVNTIQSLIFNSVKYILK